MCCFTSSFCRLPNARRGARLDRSTTLARDATSRLTDRQGHAVLFSGVPPDLGDEPVEVLGRGLETALTVE